MSSNNRKFLSHSSGGQKSQVKMLGGEFLREELRETLSLAQTLGVFTSHFPVCLCLRVPFLSFYKDESPPSHPYICDLILASAKSLLPNKVTHTGPGWHAFLEDGIPPGAVSSSVTYMILSFRDEMYGVSCAPKPLDKKSNVFFFSGPTTECIFLLALGVCKCIMICHKLTWNTCLFCNEIH